MTISEFEQEFMGHVPEIMGTKAHYAVLVPLVEWRSKSSLRSGPTPWSGSPGRSASRADTWSPARALRNVPFVRPGKNWGSRRRPFAPLPGWTMCICPGGT